MSLHLQASAGLLVSNELGPHQAGGKAVAVALDDSLGKEGWEACPFNTPHQGFRWRQGHLLGEGGTASVYM